MAVKFLGYLDTQEEGIMNGQRRGLFGISSDADLTNLPTTAGFVLPSGATTAKPAGWSMALELTTGSVYVYDGTWKQWGGGV